MMSDKIVKLEEATEKSKAALDEAKAAFEDSEKRLNYAKEALRQMDPEDQKKIQVNDTKLPELIDMHRLAADQYSEAKARFETNSRYLALFKAKLGEKR
jgi:hypothetical protein